jgi:hypothetical protein
MDVVRAALGESKISYYGASYGTYLGAVYAQMFPDRVARMVLDSAVDPDDYGSQDMLADAAPANEAALHDWATWTASHDGDYHLGTSPGAVLAAVDRIIATAAGRPLHVGRYRVDDHVLPFILFSGLDDDRAEASASLAASVRVLHEAADGRTVAPTADLRDTLDFLFTGVESAAGSSQIAVLCGDKAAAHDPDTYWQRIQRAGTSQPVLGPAAVAPRRRAPDAVAVGPGAVDRPVADLAHRHAFTQVTAVRPARQVAQYCGNTTAEGASVWSDSCPPNASVNPPVPGRPPSPRTGGGCAPTGHANSPTCCAAWCCGAVSPTVCCRTRSRSAPTTGPPATPCGRPSTCCAPRASSNGCPVSARSSSRRSTSTASTG